MLRTSKRNDYLVLEEEPNAVPLQRIRQEPTLEAEVLPGDTLASIALRFNCNLSEIKRLNKIQKDNEIFAFKVVKVPLTPHNLLLDTLPKVHKSGQNSPNKEKVGSDKPPDTIPSEDQLQEKLLLASVSAAVLLNNTAADSSSAQPVNNSNEDLLMDPTRFRGYPRMIRGNDYMSLSGSDCELSWIVLLFCILVFCIIIPLIYVFFIYEHPEDFHHPHSRYDDEVRYLHHLNHNSTTTKL